MGQWWWICTCNTCYSRIPPPPPQPQPQPPPQPQPVQSVHHHHKKIKKSKNQKRFFKKLAVTNRYEPLLAARNERNLAQMRGKRSEMPTNAHNNHRLTLDEHKPTYFSEGNAHNRLRSRLGRQNLQTAISQPKMPKTGNRNEDAYRKKKLKKVFWFLGFRDTKNGPNSIFFCFFVMCVCVCGEWVGDAPVRLELGNQDQHNFRTRRS